MSNDPPKNRVGPLLYATGDVRARMVWVNGRKSDLIRNVQGVMEAAAHCMDHGTPIEHLDGAISVLIDRAAYVRQFVADVQLETHSFKRIK